MSDSALACTHCRQPMRPLRLAGHYGQQVDIDLCERCHLVWFDSLESVRLSGLGWLQMLRAMEAAHHVEHLRPEENLGCARCGLQLKTVHNQTAFGRSTARECPKQPCWASSRMKRGIPGAAGLGDGVEHSQ
jgi:hypothetical protein